MRELPCVSRRLRSYVAVFGHICTRRLELRREPKNSLVSRESDLAAVLIRRLPSFPRLTSCHPLGRMPRSGSLIGKDPHAPIRHREVL